MAMLIEQCLESGEHLEKNMDSDWTNLLSVIFKVG